MNASSDGRVAFDLAGGAFVSLGTPTGDALELGGALSLAMWLYVRPAATLPSASNASAALFHADDVYALSTLSLQLNDTAGGLRAFFLDGEGTVAADAFAPAVATPGAWTHVALTVGADGRLRLYANGTQVADSGGAAVVPLPATPRDYVLLGLALDNATAAPTGGVLPGALADVQLYDFALSAATAAALAAARTDGCAPYAEYTPLVAPRSACWNADARFAADASTVLPLNASIAALRNSGTSAGLFAPANATFGPDPNPAATPLAPYAQFGGLQLDGATQAVALGAGRFGTGNSSGARPGVTVSMRVFLSQLPQGDPQYLFSFGTPDRSVDVRIGQRFHATVGAAGDLAVLYDLVAPVRALPAAAR